MTSAQLTPDARPAALDVAKPSNEEMFWRAPLVPLALAATVGLVADRYADIPLPIALLLAVLGLLTWALFFFDSKPGPAAAFLGVSAAALGAGYHHAYRNSYAADDIGAFAAIDPKIVRLRGVLEEEPTIQWQPPHGPLQSIPPGDPERIHPTVTIFRVTQLHRGAEWLTVSGRALLTIHAPLTDLHVGDGIEVVGRLLAPRGPANPGEFDYAAFLRDERIRAHLVVVKTAEGVTRLTPSGAWSFAGGLAWLRSWAERTLERAMPTPQSGLATALLLGQSSSMTRADWEKYIRTGVIHVLAISGQHLIVLAAFLWWPIRLLGLRRRRTAWTVALFVLGYALLAGGRPPVMRSAVMVGVACGGLLLRRRAPLANAFAAAWLLVAMLNPTDLFNTGCQLSFLSVAMLYWGIGRWFRRDPDPLTRLVEQSRPAWQRLVLPLARGVAVSYAVTFVIWLGLLPLVASRYHLISLAGLIIGPPVVFLTTVALIAGFLLLLIAAVGVPLVTLCAWVTASCLAGCDGLVRFSEALPGNHWYVGTIPDWWLWLFYPGLLLGLTVPLLRRHERWLGLAGLVWLCVGLLSSGFALPRDELRCTFLAVGHGGCTVLEMPDGRTLLYDAGALGGPDVTRRQIAPYLWQRGIRRIDEVFLSHADLDHFNGLPELGDRFAIGLVRMTPSFAEKDLPGVRHVLDYLARQRIPVQQLRAGDRLRSGDVHLDVLHPPAVGPEGNENSRSLVLRLRHAGRVMLLTGDLEGPGLARVLALPAVPIDVLMAPHHGSRFPNTPELAEWAQPKVVVSCEGPPLGPTRPPEPYTPRGALFLGTWPHGAVTVHSHARGLVVETFQTSQRFFVQPHRLR